MTHRQYAQAPDVVFAAVEAGTIRRGDAWVYLALDWHYNARTKVCNPTLEQVASKAHMTPRGVQYALRNLEAAALIATTRAGRSFGYRNSYQLRGRAPVDNPIQRVQPTAPSSRERVQSTAGALTQSTAPSEERERREEGGGGDDGGNASAPSPSPPSCTHLASTNGGGARTCVRCGVALPPLEAHA